jgi:hypothetical protein
MVLVKERRSREAAELLDQVIEKDPSNAQHYLDRGVAHMLLNKEKEAVQASGMDSGDGGREGRRGLGVGRGGGRGGAGGRAPARVVRRALCACAGAGRGLLRCAPLCARCARCAAAS